LGRLNEFLGAETTVKLRIIPSFAITTRNRTVPSIRWRYFSLNATIHSLLGKHQFLLFNGSNPVESGNEFVVFAVDDAVLDDSFCDVSGFEELDWDQVKI